MSSLPIDPRAGSDRMVERMRALVSEGDTPVELPTHVVIGLTARA